MSWSLATARDQFSELVRRARDEGPQTISVRGTDTAVVLSKTDYEALAVRAPPKDFKSFLKSIPRIDDLDLSRDHAPPRDVDL